MGKVVVSNEEERTVSNEDEKSKKNEEESSSVIKWEKFLPNVSVRVLVVESDDSTRHIIGALLRKCSYKVASVSDGLQAWEVLKARPHNIDLILTEVDLPSISGFALLTLIMEHEICKNIPVIMMSTNDSVSTVYKCMLRGAADFLVKPIRTNELRNLWQHVWRRQSMNQQGFGAQDESIGQQKLEATAENNATSDNSVSSKSCAPSQDEVVKKGSDAQSSCGKPDLEAESGSLAEVVNQLQPIHVAGSHALGNGNHTVDDEEGGTRLEQADVNPYTEVGGSMGSFQNSSREAIDLIGSLRNYSRPNVYANDDGSNKYEFAPDLDLSLRRFQSHVLEDKQMLNHSNASAFTRYVNKPQQQQSDRNVTSVYTSKDQVVNRGDHTSDNTKNSTLPPYERKVISLANINQKKAVENGERNAAGPSQRRLFPSTNNPPTTVDTSSSPSPSPSPSSTNQQPNSYQSIQEERAQTQVYPAAADQSVCVSNGNGGYVNVEGEGCVVDHSLTRHRSIQREAALHKFRLKRKERCFEKKVRYQSRKKLAEQRPRVKGQFVRQVPPDPPPKTPNSGPTTLVAN